MNCRRSKACRALRREIERQFGFTPDFEQAKDKLEKRRRRKHVQSHGQARVIGTAVVGARR